MKILGFNFTKIQIEKFKDKTEDLKIGTRIDILSVEEAKADLLKLKETVLAVKFNYGLDYNPDLAKIDLEGSAVISVEPKQAKEILKQWKSKKIPDDFKTPLFNLILRKSSLRALQLEEEMNLPIHMQLPSVKIQDKKE